MSTRKCSRDNCPAQNTAKDVTVHCYRCKCQIHLICHGIDRKPEEIFISSNIVMMCDECINGNYEQPSPKRKSSFTNLVQRTLDANMQLSAPLATESPTSKASSVKPITQKLIETLSLEVKLQTATISALKSSIDSMHVTITKEKCSASNPIGLNNEA